MFVRIAIDQAVSLHEVGDLGRLHVEVAGLDDRALQSAVRSHGLGRVRDGDELDLRITALRVLAGEQDDQWLAAFGDMLDYAEAKGWKTDDEHVRAHRVRIAALPFDQSAPS